MKTKVILSKQKTEIIKQVRLTTNQRLELVKMSNSGGRAHQIDWRVRHDLFALGLIIELDGLTPQERRAAESEITALWQQVPAMAKAKNAEGLDSLVDNIRLHQRKISSKAYWLTAAANEYLVKGRVVIER